MGGMGGMMGGGRVPNLKHLEPENRIQAITYCKDTYRVTTANGQTRKFWERNLRLKTGCERRRSRKECARSRPSRNVGRPCRRDLCRSERNHLVHREQVLTQPRRGAGPSSGRGRGKVWQGDPVKTTVEYPYMWSRWRCLPSVANP
jgi:hypothetical protein